MRTPTLLLACAALVIVPATRADRIDDMLQGEMQQRQIPGLALGIVRDGNPIKTAAYGLANVELQTPAMNGTVFEIGSLSKQFTAAGILLLQQDGRLSVDDAISRHLTNTPAAWSNITVRHLLTHTSGLKSYTGMNGFELTRHLSQQQFIRAIATLPVDFKPGEAWKYSNTGYNLIGFIIENVSGKTYWDFMRERIFHSLGMNATTDRRPDTVIPNRADGYEHTNRTLINRDYDLTDVFAAGAIVSTVGDLAAWDAVLNTTNLLTVASKEQMWTPVTLNNGTTKPYGFGWNIETLDGRRNTWHGGSTSGFSATIQRFPDDKLTVILLTNTDEQIATTLAGKVAAIVFSDVRFNGVREPRP